MKVKIKKGKQYFYDGKMRNEGDELILKKREGIGFNDEPVTITVEQQFSKTCMETLEKPKKEEKKEEPKKQTKKDK
jgi:hypothetical protein